MRACEVLSKARHGMPIRARRAGTRRDGEKVGGRSWRVPQTGPSVYARPDWRKKRDRSSGLAPRRISHGTATDDTGGTASHTPVVSAALSARTTSSSDLV